MEPEMKICGLQETTLIDYPGKIACTIFVFGCNFRCGFCHNPELVIERNDNTISEEKVLEFLKKRQGQLEGVCITGGEPFMTLKERFLEKIKELGYSIKVDTNGSFPDRLKDFIQKGLINFISMDIKSKKEKYHETCSCNVDIKKIEESIKAISNLEDYEFRTTIVEDMHPVEDMKEMAKWVMEVCGKKPKKFVLQGFKNSGKTIDPKFKLKKNTSEEYLKKIKKEIEPYFEKVRIRV